MTARMHNNVFIGWASRDVTPDRPVNLLGQFQVRIATTARDPVTVTALVLASGKPARDYAIFVSCDAAVIDKTIDARCRQAVKARLPGLDVSKIILHATHTHTAPQAYDSFWYPPQGPGVMTPTEYAGLFATRVAEAVAEAWETRQPGGVSWGFGYAVVGHNRRVVYFEGGSRQRNEQHVPGRWANGTAAMYGATNDPQFSHLEGYVDHSLDLLFTWERSRKLTGMIINLPCPSQETENEETISADFWHDIRTAIRQKHGKHLFVLPQCSAAGDLSPHPLLHKQAEDRMLKLQGRSRREDIARRVAAVVDEVLPCVAREIATNLPFAHVVKTVRLPRRLVTRAEYEEVKADLRKLEKQYARNPDALASSSATGRCRDLLERYRQQKHDPDWPVELHFIRLGDIALVTNPFELFLDFGLRIKARSKALQTFVIQLTPGEEGYLPTTRAVAGGGYSAGIFDNQIGPEGGQKLVNTTVRNVAALWKK